MKAVKDFQTRVGLPADGYGGLEGTGAAAAGRVVCVHLALRRTASAQNPESILDELNSGPLTALAPRNAFYWYYLIIAGP